MSPPSNHRTLWRLAITTSPEADDAVTVLLSETFGLPVSSWIDFEAGETVVSLWFPRRPSWPLARRAALVAGLRRIEASGLRMRPCRISLKKVRREDWAQSWRRHFPPLEFGSALLIRPSWSRRGPRPGQAVVQLDPGLSFGTGRHPTTAFCLKQIVAKRRAGQLQSFLDVGTGSGILAIAAAKMGFDPVEAVDFDPDAVRVAGVNARRNRVSASVRFLQSDLANLPRRPARRFTVICANLTANLLIPHRHRLLVRLEAHGVLILAGILTMEFPAVRKIFETAGLKLAATRIEDEWQSGAFVRRET